MSVTWEPTEAGTTVTLRGKSFHLTIEEVGELMNDMEEAYQLARGHEKVRIPVEQVQVHDKVYVGGHVLTVRNILSDRLSTILQSHDEEEVSIQPERILTVWRRIE